MYGGFNVTLSYERTGLRTLVFFSFLLIVRPFLHNDLLSFQLARLSYLFFFLRAFPYLKRKRNVVLPGISSFSSSPMYFFRAHLSLSFFRRFSLAPLARLSPPFVDAQCSRALNHGSLLVGLPLSSSDFWISAFSPVGSHRIAGRGTK